MSMLIGVGQEGGPLEPNVKTSARVSGFSRCSTLCFLTKLNFNGVRPPFGGKGGGERKRGEGGRDLPPGGPCAQRIPSPPSSPPLGPRNPTGNPSLCFFSSFSFYFFGSTCHQLRDCCQGSFHFLLSLSLCNVLLLQPLAFLKCSIL